MRPASTTLVVVFVVLQFCCSLWARPMTADEAEKVVAGRLRADAQLPGNAPGRDVLSVETFSDEEGRTVYYVVYLQPSGYVVVSADNSIEPIIAFAGGGDFEPSVQNPLWVLVNNDLKGRTSAVQDTFSLQADAAESPSRKWRYLIDLAEAPDDGIALMGLGTVSDVRVEPLVQSKWGQLHDACGEYCYNYYTPRHYYCGCTATAMAQLMRYHGYPDANMEIGTSQFEITVNDVAEFAQTLGGDGNGGPYNWELMVYEPDCSTTAEKRQAIGALCYDAGIAALTEYSITGSASSLRDAREALLNTFGYSNAVRAFRSDSVIEGDWLNDMINANLDAGYPVILGIKNLEAENGHAALADGYGYDLSTLYHHLNMGWEGADDVWYNLPDVNYIPAGYYDVIEGCLYNIFPSGTGEIISGRVTDISGNPISEAMVTAQGGKRLYSAVTDSKGIYAFVDVTSYATYSISVARAGFTFGIQSVEIEKSGNSRNSSGNKWGVNFVGDYVSASNPVVSDCSTEDFETGNFGKFPWEHSGDGNWEVTPTDRYSGTYSAQAGQIGNGGSVSLIVNVDCVAGDIKFARKVSSELGFDFFKFCIDGVEVYRSSGIRKWDEVSFPVEAGTRTFKWTYSKDSSLSRGDDTVWIDDIKFPINCN
jgi:hypothetical protein